MPEYCIISFANNRGNYIQGLSRLAASLSDKFSGAFLGYVDESSVGAPYHFLNGKPHNPYAFKVYCFRKALKAGYRKILYLDSSVFAVRNVQPAFDIIDRDGYLMQEAGHYLKNWINDDALQYFGISRSALDGVIMYGNAGLLGLDFNTEIARTFFEKWEKSMQAGMFKGSWDDHRHDMACGSMIAWLMYMDKKYVKGDQLLEYAHWDAPIKNDSIVFKAAGL